MTYLRDAAQRLLAFADAEAARRDGTGGEYEAEAFQAVKDAESLLEVTTLAVVKELERRDHLSGIYWDADSPIGLYSVESPREGRFWPDAPDGLTLNEPPKTTYDTLGAAKAACQADYEKRVLACLVPSALEISPDEAEPTAPPSTEQGGA